MIKLCVSIITDCQRSPKICYFITIPMLFYYNTVLVLTFFKIFSIILRIVKQWGRVGLSFRLLNIDS